MVHIGKRMAFNLYNLVVSEKTTHIRHTTLCLSLVDSDLNRYFGCFRLRVESLQKSSHFPIEPSIFFIKTEEIALSLSLWE